jgi:cytochrome c
VILTGAFAIVLTGMIIVTPASAQQPQTPLRNVVADQVVKEIVYCRGEYRLTMVSGATRRVPEINVRLKIDRTAYGPEPGRPVLLPAGMRGDRIQIIFSGPGELKDFLVERCEGGS